MQVLYGQTDGYGVIILKYGGVILLFIVIVITLAAGCVEKGNFENVASVNVTDVSLDTPAAPAVTPEITYPTQEEVKKYVADLKKVPQDEVKIIDFQNIIAPMSPPIQTYHSGGYVAVIVIISNYSSLVMAYKDHSEVIIIGNYTASTDDEKKLYDLLKDIPYYRNGYEFGHLIPTNITIINSSYTINKNESFKVNYSLPPMEKPYASFEFVTGFIGNHGFWAQSYGWIDVKKKQVWIRQGY